MCDAGVSRDVFKNAILVPFQQWDIPFKGDAESVALLFLVGHHAEKNREIDLVALPSVHERRGFDIELGALLGTRF